MKKTTTIIVLISLIIVFFALKNYPINDVKNIMSSIPIIHLVLYLIVCLSIYIFHTLRWKEVLKSQNENISFMKLFNYRLVGNAISYFTPGPRFGGEAIQANLLRIKENISYTKALSSIIIEKSIDLLFTAISFIVGSLLFVIFFPLSQSIKFLLSSVSVLFLILIILFFYNFMNNKHILRQIYFKFGIYKIKKLQKFEHKIIEFEDRISNFYKNEKKHFIISAIYAIIAWIVMWLEYYIALSFFTPSNPSIFNIFLVVTFMGAAYIFPFPMAIGALEASQVTVFKIMKIPISSGIAMALLIRGKDLLFSFYGLIIYIYYKMKNY